MSSRSESLTRHLRALIPLVAALALPALSSAVARADDRYVLSNNHPVAALLQPEQGNADPAQPLTMEVRLELRNTEELDALLQQQQDQASPNYHKWLKTGEFDRRFGPRPEDVDAVARWLQHEGFVVGSTGDGHIEFSGNVAQAQSSFAVRIARLGATTYANVEDPSIPRQFDGVIAAITGLDNMMRAVPLLQRAAPQPAIARPGVIVNQERAFGPQDMRTFYNETVQNGSDGSGTCIAIIGASEVSAAALSAFNGQFGLPPNDLVIKAAKSPGETQDDSEVEAELDIEWSHAVAPGASQKLFIGSGADSLANAITNAVKDNSCSVISISFGLCSASNSEFTKVLDAQFKKAAAQGQSVFVSSGDEGAAALEVMNNRCVASNSVGISELAGDPNVTAVGGTEATPTFDGSGNDVGYAQENTWNTPGLRPGATGGGASKLFAKPAFQKGPGVPADGKRDIPDIALIASPVAPGVFFGDAVSEAAQVTCCLGGTSLSAPLMAGFTLIMNQQMNQRFGNLNPTIYALADLQYGSQPTPEGFHDITTGNNDFRTVTGFNAGPAYDQTTGWGSIDFDVFASAVKNNPLPTGPLTFPKSVSFGSHRLGTPLAKPKVIKLSNPAKNKVAAVLTADAALLDTTDFRITASTCTNGASIGAGKPPCTVSVQFDPQTANPAAKSTKLIFTDNGSNSPQSVTLTGKAVAPKVK